MPATPAKKEFLRNNLILLAFVIILFFLNFYSKTLFSRPSGIHQWRQTDCLSIAKNYYEEGMNFFEPKIHYQGPKGGHAVSECPILNYTGAILWKVFGEEEYLYRLMEYLIYLAAIFTLYNTMGRYYRVWLLAFFAVSILLTSPLLAFYSLNFIADVPALSMSIICYCLFYRFYREKNMRHFYLALLFGSLAVLMKASALIPLGILIFFTLVDVSGLNKLFKTERLLKKKLIPVITVVIAVLLIFLWYRFALAYNNNHKNLVFLLTVLPIWDMQESEIIYNLKHLFNNLFPVFLNKPMLFLFLLVVMYVIAKFKQLNSFLKYSFVFSGVYFLFYLLFFFQVFSVHDYYLNNLMIFPAITFMCFAHIASESEWMTSNRSFAWIAVIAITFFNSFHVAAVYRMRMIEDDKMVYWFPFISEEEKNLAKYLFWDYGNSIKKIENITGDLREHGIKREDFVLSIPDQSFDISLYFMDQKGFTIARDHIMNDPTVAEKFMNRNIKYVVLSDTTVKTSEAYRQIEYRLERVFVKNGVEVLRLK